MEKILVRDLEGSYQDYLGSLKNGDEDRGIPVYLKVENKVFFISDYSLNDNKLFEQTAPEGLYRGGGVLDLITDVGRVVIYDERKKQKWFRPIGGIARKSEGSNLVDTAIREFLEEIAVVTEDEQTRLIPKNNKKNVSTLISNWGFSVSCIREAGEIKVVHGFFNDVNKAYELLIRWDISGENNLHIFHSEAWHNGGQTGFVPFVLDHNGSLVGLYDGRHGYVPLPITRYHPTLTQLINR